MRRKSQGHSCILVCDGPFRPLLSVIGAKTEISIGRLDSTRHGLPGHQSGHSSRLETTSCGPVSAKTVFPLGPSAIELFVRAHDVRCFLPENAWTAGKKLEFFSCGGAAPPRTAP